MFGLHGDTVEDQDADFISAWEAKNTFYPVSEKMEARMKSIQDVTRRSRRIERGSRFLSENPEYFSRISQFPILAWYVEGGYHPAIHVYVAVSDDVYVAVVIKKGGFVFSEEYEFIPAPDPVVTQPAVHPPAPISELIAGEKRLLHIAGEERVVALEEAGFYGMVKVKIQDCPENVFPLQNVPKKEWLAAPLLDQ